MILSLSICLHIFIRYTCEMVGIMIWLFIAQKSDYTVLGVVVLLARAKQRNDSQENSNEFSVEIQSWISSIIEMQFISTIHSQSTLNETLVFQAKC